MDDFDKFLQEMGLTHEDLENVEIPKPLKKHPLEPYYIGASGVHGEGAFALEDIDGFVGRLWENGEWYELGRYANHGYPNCIPQRVGDVIILIGKVKKGEEILVDYRDIAKEIM